MIFKSVLVAFSIGLLCLPYAIRSVFVGKKCAWMNQVVLMRFGMHIYVLLRDVRFWVRDFLCVALVYREGQLLL